MAKVEISKAVHKTFGNCVKMENGLVELWVTVDFGPRVIHFSLAGKENMLYEDETKSAIGEPLAAYNGEALRLYGGHRLWISPEVMPRCYFPDSKPVECVPVENGMDFIAPMEEINGIQKSISITLAEGEPTAILEHGVKNCGQWEIELAPWAITMTAPGGVGVTPVTARKAGFLPNRSVSLWDYSAMNDPRVYWGKDFITMKHDATNPRPFKMGVQNEAGWAAVFNKGQLFFKFFEMCEGGAYPDGGCNYESYINGKMIECESLGELEYLEPGEWAAHTEEWSLFEEGAVRADDEEGIRKAVSKYL